MSHAGERRRQNEKQSEVSKTEARRQFTTFTRLPHFVPISCSLVSSLTLSKPCSHSVVIHPPTWSLSPCPQRPPHQSAPTTHIHPDDITNHGRSGQALLGLCRSLAETRRRHHCERSESAHIPTLPDHLPNKANNSIKIDVSSVATHFGTTYDTIENRLRPVKKQAKELKEAVSNGTQDRVVSTRKSPTKPKTPRKAATSFDGQYLLSSRRLLLC